MAQYGSSDSGASLGDILGAAIRTQEAEQRAEADDGADEEDSAGDSEPEGDSAAAEDKTDKDA